MEFVSFFGPWVAPQVLVPVVVIVAYLAVRRYFRSEEKMKKEDKKNDMHEALNLWVNDGGGAHIRRIFREEFSTAISAHEKLERNERDGEREEWRKELIQALSAVKVEIESEGHRDCDRVLSTLNVHDQRLTTLEALLEREKIIRRRRKG